MQVNGSVTSKHKNIAGNTKLPSHGSDVYWDLEVKQSLCKKLKIIYNIITRNLEVWFFSLTGSIEQFISMNWLTSSFI